MARKRFSWQTKATDLTATAANSAHVTPVFVGLISQEFSLNFALSKRWIWVASWCGREFQWCLQRWPWADIARILSELCAVEEMNLGCQLVWERISVMSPKMTLWNMWGKFLKWHQALVNAWLKVARGKGAYESSAIVFKNLFEEWIWFFAL